MTHALEVRGVTKRFGPLRAASSVSFAVDPGTIMGFIGPNGAGKTTTMRICATLDVPDEGDVFVNGLSVLENAREVRRILGFMPDAYGAYANTTVLEYLDFFARAYGLKGSRRRDTVAQVIDFTSLGTLVDKEMGSLSKGMKQRLCLAKTLLHDPKVLILDEPAAGLDPRARIELRELLRTLAEMGKAILISSHILTELSEMCHGVAIIERGTIRATGAVADVTRSVQAKLLCFVRTLSSLDEAERALRELPGVHTVRPDGTGLLFELDGGDAEMERILAELVARRLRPVEFAVRSQNLEDLFMALTEGKVQ
jgi:ABC-2 type transport system ATP-binding protein